MDLPEKVKWETSEKQRYLMIDFSGCSDEERISISKQALELIKNEAFSSVNILVDLRDTTVSVESMRVVKNDWIKMSPYLKKVAMIGVTGSKSLMLKLWGFMTSMKTQVVGSEREGIVYFKSK